MSKLKKIEYGSMIGVTLFVVIAKGLPVWLGLEQYGVNVWVFLFLDIVTIWPWVKSLSGVVQNLYHQGPLSRTLKWGIVAILSFSAPYVYLYVAGGKQFPKAVSIFIGVLIFLFALQAIRGAWKKKRAFNPTN